MTPSTDKPTLHDLLSFKVILFDLDGVLTPTANLHQQAWATMFQAFLAERGERAYTDQDYFTYLDGRRRDEAIQALLDSRGITVPFDRADAGEDGDDDPADNTITGLGMRKNRDFLDLLTRGITPYPGSRRLVDAINDHNTSCLSDPTHMGVVSSSKNAPVVLESAGLTHYFPHIVDGTTAEEKNLKGKPAPDTYIYGAELFGLSPADAVIVEDATSGVAAGKNGEFGYVLGVNRGAGEDALRASGAHAVVNDLAELM
ncbi:HAD family hydrolase [Corynebacterium kroppenstedtii]|uniref:HAD family hydrolase n=1 Tax=Corynebacterium sp. PCR 32 TaxID=3351342 RepID=UPI00309AB5F6